MQSHDGDVQLSVTLDTSKLKKETEKIKAEIESGVKSAGTDIKPNADVKPIQQVAKSAQEASSQFNELVKQSDFLSSKLKEVQSQLESVKNAVGESSEQYKKLLEEAEKIKSTLEAVSSLMNDIKKNSSSTDLSMNMGEVKEDTEDINAEMDRLQAILDRNRKKAEELKNSLAESDEDRISYVDPDSMKHSEEALKFVRELEEESQNAQQASKEAVSQTTSQFKDEYATFIEYIKSAENKAKEMADVIAGLKDVGTDPEELAKMEAEYDALINKIALMRQSIVMGSTAWNDMSPKEKLVQFAYKLKAGFEAMGNSILEKAVPAFKRFLVNAGNLVKSSVIKGLRTITTLFKKLTPQINASNKGLATGLRKILGYAVGISSLIMLFNKLRAAAKEGINNLAQWKDGNNAVNENLSVLISYLLQLKNQIAAAFAPIITTVVPILNTFIDSLIEATNYLAQFLAKLMGQDSWIKATRVQKNYADSLKGTGKAAKDASGSLAKFDDLDILSKKDAGAGAGGIDPNDMFEEMPIEEVEDNVDNWIEKLKLAWDSADFSDFGSAVGEWLKSALDSIPWGYIKETAQKIAHSLATFLNGFFETENLGKTIGTTIARAFETAFAFINEFVHTLHWDSIGKFIGEALVSFVTEFPWKEAGEALGGAVVGILTTAYNAVKTFTEQNGWENLTSGILTFIDNFLEEMNKVDEESGLTGWQKLGETIYMTLHGAMSSLKTFIDELPIDDIMDGIGEAADSTNASKLADDFIGLGESILKAIAKVLRKIDWKDVGVAIGEMLNKIPELGDELLDLAGVVLDALVTAVGSLVSTIDSQHPLVTDIAAIIGAALLAVNAGLIPASALASIKAVLATVLGGIGSVGLTIGSVVILGITTAKVGFDFGKWLGKTLFPEDSQWYVNFKWSDFINEKGLKATLEDIWNGLVLMCDTALDNIANKVWQGVQSIIEGFVQGLVEGVVWLKTKWDAFWEDVIFWFKECWGIHSPSAVMEGFGENIIQGLINGIEALKNKLIELWENIKKSISDKIVEMKESVMTKIDTFKLNFLSAFVEIKSKFVSLWNKIKDAIKTPINAILAGVENMVNGFIKGINKMIEAINKIGNVKVPDWAKKFGIDDFSINLKTIDEIHLPRLAQGAVIPPNREFMAVLGDQTQGTNIEAPLDTITQAFADVMESMPRGVSNAVMQVDGQTFARLMVPYVVNELSRRGYNTKILEA